MDWIGQVLELMVASAEGAFIEVGVFVGAVLLLFALVDFYNRGKFIAYIERSRRYQPALGALLGLTPGCGGAIFVMPLFFKGSVTFGTVVATLMATMGDAAFVLMASSPLHYLLVSVLSYMVAVITGYAVDRTPIGHYLLTAYRRQLQASALARSSPLVAPGRVRLAISPGHASLLNGLFWVIIGTGLVLGLANLAQVEVNQLAVPNLGLAVGVSGTSLSLAVMGWGRQHLRRHTSTKSLSSTLMESFLDTAFVVTWVFIGYLAYKLLVLGAGGGDYAVGQQVVQSLFLSVGVATVFVAVMVGIIPGCGPQIIFVSLFVQGLVPFSALLANAVSQDGDALFPVLAMDRRSALWSTLLNKIPALALGLTFYWVERNIDFAGWLDAAAGVVHALFSTPL